MPVFSIESLRVDIDEFYCACSKEEIKELIKLLIKDEKVFGFDNETGELDVREVYDMLDMYEIEEMIDILTYEGKLEEHQYVGHVRSVSEMDFEKSLKKLHGSWNRLTQEEEDIITKIANRF